MKVFYHVRVLDKKGKVVNKRRFTAVRKAMNFAKDKLVHGRRVKLYRQQVREAPFRVITDWGKSGHSPYQFASGPLSTVFLHTSVTRQLPASATLAQEKAAMREVDQIGKNRGFNGISYSFCIAPSGHVFEGRGFLVVEAATEPHNASSDSICFLGNTDAFKPTAAQMEAVHKLIELGQAKGKWRKSGLNIRGHREVAPKACPGKFVTDAMIAELQRKVNR